MNADTPLRQFERTMAIDYEKWHDGIGYNLEALRAASPAERAAIETMLLHRSLLDWRDIEALATLDTPRAHEALRAAFRNGNAEIRAAVLRHAPARIPGAARTVALVGALASARFYGGLIQTLDQVAEFHPAAVADALVRGAGGGPRSSRSHDLPVSRPAVASGSGPSTTLSISRMRSQCEPCQ